MAARRSGTVVALPKRAAGHVDGDLALKVRQQSLLLSDALNGLRLQEGVLTHTEWVDRITALWVLVAVDLAHDAATLYRQTDARGLFRQQLREIAQEVGVPSRTAEYRVMATPRIGRPDVLAAHRAGGERSWRTAPTARVPVDEVATRAREIADGLARLKRRRDG